MGLAVLAVATTLATGASAAASTARTGTGTHATSAARSPHAPTTAPAKVRPGSVWTLELPGSSCESDAFASDHAFSALPLESADEGIYKERRTKLTMTWRAGAASGAVYRGTWHRRTGEYSGTYMRAGQSVSATLVAVAVAGCAVVTTAPVTNATGIGSSDADTAAVTGQGGITPTGDIHFYVCPGDTGPCTTGSAGVVDLGTDQVSGSGDTATATSSWYFPGATGGYCFLGVYSGDGHYLPSSDGASSDECFTVGSSNATVTTAPTGSSIVVGMSDSDTATVTGFGTVTPTGDVHFYVCPGDAGPCTADSAGVADLGTDPVSGSGASATATSAPYSPAAAGGYCFLAVYSGDGNYAPASDGSTTQECFTVDAGGSELTTAPSESSIVQGSYVFDTATVTGDGGTTPTGTVTFYLCGPETDPAATPCSNGTGSPVGSPVTVSGSGDVATATSATDTPPSTGLYCFFAVYSGDNHDVAATDGSTASECFSVDAGTSSGPSVGILALNKVGPHEILSGGTGQFTVAGDIVANTDVPDQPWSAAAAGYEWDDAIDAKNDSSLAVYGTIFSSNGTGTGQFFGDPLWPLDSCFMPSGIEGLGESATPAYTSGGPPPAYQLSCTEEGGSVQISYDGIDNDQPQIDDPMQSADAPADPWSRTIACPGMGSQVYDEVPAAVDGVTTLLPGVYPNPVQLTGSVVFDNCSGYAGEPAYPGVYNFVNGLWIDPQSPTDTVTGSDVLIATQNPYPVAGNVPGSATDGAFTATGSGNGAPCLPSTTLTSASSGGGTPEAETSPTACGGTNPTTYGVIVRSDFPENLDPTMTGTGSNYSLIIGGAPGATVRLTGPTSGPYGDTDGPGVLLYQDPDTQANYGFDAEAGDSASVTLNGVVYNASLDAYGAEAPQDYWDGQTGGVPFYAGGTLQTGYGTGWSDGPLQSAGSVIITGTAIVDDVDTDGATSMVVVGEPYTFPGSQPSAAQRMATRHTRSPATAKSARTQRCTAQGRYGSEAANAIAKDRLHRSCVRTSVRPSHPATARTVRRAPPVP
jgi:hypothetical protein